MFTVTLMGGTFDLFDGHCDWQSGLHTNFAVNVTFVTESLGVNRALNRFPVPQRFPFHLIVLSRLGTNFSHAL